MDEDGSRSLDELSNIDHELESLNTMLRAETEESDQHTPARIASALESIHDVLLRIANKLEKMPG